MPSQIMDTVERGAGLAITVGVAGAVMNATQHMFKQPKRKKKKNYVSY